MDVTSARIAVVGGGISGLATAYKEKKKGNDVTLFEASSCVGGKIATRYCEGFELDLGPVTISETPELNALISDLGLEIIEASNAVGIRYIYSKGRLHLVRNPITSSVLSLGGKLSMLKAPLISKAKEDESVALYARRRFGEQAYQRLFNPMMNGIYAGNAELLSARWCIPKRRGPRKIIGLNGGFKMLTKAIADQLGKTVLTNSPVNDLKDLKDFDKIYLTTPAFVTAKLLGQDELKSIRYNNLMQIYCEVVPGEKKFDGFGFLVPSEERMSLLGAVCVSNIFPSKAPDGKMLFVLFCGGDRPYDLTWSVKDALAEFNLILQPAFNRVLHMQESKDAIPQFYVGHEKLIAGAKPADPRIVLRGNYITGVSVGDCL